MEKEIFYITGATGWVGYNVVNELLKRNKEIVIFVLENDKFKDIFNDHLDKITVIYGDITNIDDVRRFLNAKKEDKIIQKVIHSAGIVTVEQKFNQKVYDVNVKGTQNIVDISYENHVDHFVYVSTTHVFIDQPKNHQMVEVKEFQNNPKAGLYAITKAEATRYVLKKADEGLNASIIHPSAIIGPRDYMEGLMTSMILMFLRGKLPASVNGAYDLVDVRDVAHALIETSYLGEKGENYIISGHQKKITDLINEVARLTNKKKIKLTLPYWFVSSVTPMYEWYCKRKHQKVLYTKNALIAVRNNSNFSHSKATRVLNYHPRPLEETLQDVIDDLYTRYPEIKNK